MSTLALILAAGRSERMGLATPKQYQKISGRAMLAHSMRVFLAHHAIDAVAVVIDATHRSAYNSAISDFMDCAKLRSPVIGGACRQASVLAGLEAYQASPPEFVLIHDAARPFVHADLISNALRALRVDSALAGVVPACRATDTIKQVAADRSILQTLARDTLYTVQTPQVFRFAAILTAHQKTSLSDTPDDAQLAEVAGLQINIIDGAHDNVKITYPADLASGGGVTRIGVGFDVHAFDAPDSAHHIMLGGVQIPYHRKIIGHSDGDVILHALADALYGSVAAGDIGMHFPSSDTAHRNRDSADFLTHAATCITASLAHITHIDVTVICTEPKIAPQQMAMRNRIAEILKIAPSQVSVKATTTDGLGFTGRGEGIAAHATATITQQD